MDGWLYRLGGYGIVDWSGIDERMAWVWTSMFRKKREEDGGMDWKGSAIDSSIGMC